MSARHYISIVTAILIIITLFFSRHSIEHAWQLLQQVNVWILLLLIPLQALSYYAVGAMIFSYLKQRGALKATSPLETTKMALELNFVNHVLPSGGVSGASYMTWRLNKLGVGAGRATLAQVVRFVASFAAFLVLLVISLIFITLDGTINRLTILGTSGLAFGIIAGIVFLIFIIDDEKRLKLYSHRISRVINGLFRKIFRRTSPLLESEKIETFLSELHSDYATLKKDPRVLVKPLMWGFVFNLAEVSMFLVSFWALGTLINPAPLLIAYGLATIAGFFIVTPGGAGGYELIMITILTSAGIPQSATVAAVLLTRTLLIIGTILSGYIFYQIALGKYGKRPAHS